MPVTTKSQYYLTQKSEIYMPQVIFLKIVLLLTPLHWRRRSKCAVKGCSRQSNQLPRVHVNCHRPIHKISCLSTTETRTVRSRNWIRISNHVTLNSKVRSNYSGKNSQTWYIVWFRFRKLTSFLRHWNHWHSVASPAAIVGDFVSSPRRCIQ